MNEKYFREYILEETGRIKNFQNKLENNEVREDRIYSVKRKIDAILLTGGIAYSDYVISRLKKRISFLAPIHIYPGENEMESLAFNALGALKGELPIQIYK